MAASNGMTAILLAEILAGAHRYTPGVEQYRPTSASPSPAGPRLIIEARERARDLLERAAGRAGFSHRHFDPNLAAARLERVLALAQGLEATYGMLADAPSRRTLIDVLKLRVLGPYHARLAITPEAYRSRQAYADRELRVRPDTFTVSDPWFSPLALYRAPVEDGPPVTLHCHSITVVSVFLLGQYHYARGAQRVRAEPGDVVLDIGGCYGDTALWFATQVGPKGKVYTFEFDPESLEVLRANLALNPDLAKRIEVVERALWDRSGERLPFVQAGGVTTVLDGEHEAGAPRVTTCTLDDFVAEAGIDRLGFVKMDVEGAERRVLRGACQSLRRFAPKLAIAAYHHDDDLVRIPDELGSLELGYRLYLDTFSPVEDETVLFADRG